MGPESADLPDEMEPGEEEIAALLLELSKGPFDPVPLFRKLEGITGLTPYAEGVQGKYKLMIASWVDWGRETGLLPDEAEEDPVQGEEPSGNPLIAVLERMESRLTAIEVRQEEIGEGFKRLMGILNLMATNMTENRKPWSERNGNADAVLVDDAETDRIDTVPARAPARPEPRPSPPVVRGGRVYN